MVCEGSSGLDMGTVEQVRACVCLCVSFPTKSPDFNSHFPVHISISSFSLSRSFFSFPALSLSIINSLHLFFSLLFSLLFYRQLILPFFLFDRVFRRLDALFLFFFFFSLFFPPPFLFFLRSCSFSFIPGLVLSYFFIFASLILFISFFHLRVSARDFVQFSSRVRHAAVETVPSAFRCCVYLPIHSPSP